MHHQHRSIGGLPQKILHRRHAAGAGAVLHNDRPAEFLAQRIHEDARDEVAGATRREADD